MRISHKHLACCALLAAGLSAGCAQQPAEPPEPAPIVNLVSCAAPAGMTESEPEPDRPEGDYTQRDVALYIESLHRWGSRGWLRLARVRDHAEHCSANEKD